MDTHYTAINLGDPDSRLVPSLAVVPPSLSALTTHRSIAKTATFGSAMADALYHQRHSGSRATQSMQDQGSRKRHMKLSRTKQRSGHRDDTAAATAGGSSDESGSGSSDNSDSEKEKDHDVDETPLVKTRPGVRDSTPMTASQWYCTNVAGMMFLFVLVTIPFGFSIYNYSLGQTLIARDATTNATAACNQVAWFALNAENTTLFAPSLNRLYASCLFAAGEMPTHTDFSNVTGFYDYQCVMKNRYSQTTNSSLCRTSSYSSALTTLVDTMPICELYNVLVNVTTSPSSATFLPCSTATGLFAANQAIQSTLAGGMSSSLVRSLPLALVHQEQPTIFVCPDAQCSHVVMLTDEQRIVFSF